MFNIILGISISYLLGAIPTSYIIAKLLKGIDIREHGSGNIGATNLIRTVGKVPGITGFILDVAKGVIPVTLFASLCYTPDLIISEPLLRVVLGLSAVCGHIWTVFLKFRGGKGVATTIGVFIGLASLPTALGLLIWLIVALLSHYVSLSSIAMAASLPLLIIIFNSPVEYLVLSLVLCIFIIIRHKSNIRRLLNGTEHKIGQNKKIKKILPKP